MEGGADDLHVGGGLEDPLVSFVPSKARQVTDNTSKEVNRVGHRFDLASLELYPPCQVSVCP